MGQSLLLENLSREEQVHLVRQWGGSASDAVLESTQVFTVEGVDGFIGYRMEWGSIIVYGDPVCAPDQWAELVGPFSDFCHQKKMNFLFLMASEAFANWAFGRYCRAKIQFGEELICNPSQSLEETGSQARLVRKKVKRAFQEGVVVKEYEGNDPTFEKQFEEVGEKWLKSRSGPQIYIAHVGLFQDRSGKRWFYAEHQGIIVGVLTLDRIEKYQGWFLSHMMILENAPVGTPEILVMNTIQVLKQEKCCYLSYGVVPGEELHTISGLSKFSQKLTRMAFRLARKCFFLDGKKRFWGKFQPKSECSYLLFSQPTIGLKSILAMIRAFNVC